MANPKFRELYEAVFGENGQIKACGRDACKDLINACSELDSLTYYGNPETGIMNLDSFQKMKELYEKAG